LEAAALVLLDTEEFMGQVDEGLRQVLEIKKRESKKKADVYG
jgi:hypothetical protein